MSDEAAVQHATAVFLTSSINPSPCGYRAGHPERLTGRRRSLVRIEVCVEHAMHCFTGVDLGGIQVPATGIQHGGRACTFVRVRSSLNASRLLTAHLPG